MDDKIAITERDIDVWRWMGNHFLDTETRQDIPPTALACLKAGYSVDEAHAVWLYEVSPSLCFNLLSVAGEWAAWDDDWLVRVVRKRATRRRSRRCGKPPLRWFSRLRPDLMRPVWRSIARCMRLLLAAGPEEREALAADLTILAQHYFDFLPPKRSELDQDRIERLRALIPTAFDAFEPATVSGEHAAARERVRVAFAPEPGEP
jgi:hypothetical protein